MIQPYYEDDSVRIFHGRTEEIDWRKLGFWPIDAVITDPPYGVLDVAWDVPVPWEGDAYGAVAEGGFVCTFGLLRTLGPVVFRLEECGFEMEQEMVWSRGTLGTAGDRFGRSHELFAIHYRPPRRAPRVDRVRVPYAPASKPSPSHQRNPLGAAPGSIWYVHETSGSYAAHEHETAKPLPLMVALVQSLTDPGDVILDPFMGDGTTLRAAKDCGRKAIGIDMREECCERAAKRMTQEVLDLGGVA